ncbi:hypothetical protein [Thiohalophilus sp.]|uniref:hypothetical protein n=1 Tax=Thiohalophilus sp. TaxID=3028392 RepID=UPI002ACECADD|nr:hypothetical protein [Thiohalophilus sp.]MDZ7661907.1 hypothetical protein [Thiohalophilus sp.]MDZ7803774.1 hypothetical protein [Thiohalophilus sp.]
MSNRNSAQPKKYVGIYNDIHGGMTDTGKIIRDAWVFGLIPETETCEGWLPQGIDDLWRKANSEWEKYGFLVSNLPDDLREKFMRIQDDAIQRAREAGWDPHRDLEDEH